MMEEMRQMEQDMILAQGMAASGSNMMMAPNQMPLPPGMTMEQFMSLTVE